MTDMRSPIEKMIDEACGLNGGEMSSNLPPGCSSPDGGIEHEFEAALESLCMDIQNADEAHALRALLPPLREHMHNAFCFGETEGRMLEQQEAEHRAQSQEDRND